MKMKIMRDYDMLDDLLQENITLYNSVLLDDGKYDIFEPALKLFGYILIYIIHFLI
jgi:hypothetical protein